MKQEPNKMLAQKIQKNNVKLFFNAATFIEQPNKNSKNQSNKEKRNQKAKKTKEIGKKGGKKKQKKKRTE